MDNIRNNMCACLLPLAKSREIVKQMIKDRLNEWASENNFTDLEWLDLAARKIENSCYMHARTALIENKNTDIWCNYAMDAYSQSAGKIVANIDSAMKQICEDINFAAVVGSATVYELDPLANKKERDFINLRKCEKINVKVSRIYKCKKCGCDKTTHREYMGRGLDEGHIKAVECLTCGHSWRMC